MILKRLIVGIGTNSYIFGSSQTKEVVVIDPGGDDNRIIDSIEELSAKPIAILLTHGHFDHVMVARKILNKYEIPLMFSKKEFDSGIFNKISANRWLKEGDVINIGELVLYVLETPGHSPGSLCFYSKGPLESQGITIDGVVFTGDLIFRRRIGRSDLRGGNPSVLFSSIKNKIMYNPEITDKFLILSGHTKGTSVGEERAKNRFKNYFL